MGRCYLARGHNVYFVHIMIMLRSETTSVLVYCSIGVPYSDKRLDAAFTRLSAIVVVCHFDRMCARPGVHPFPSVTPSTRLSLSMHGKEIITVTPNVAVLFALFKVERCRYRVLREQTSGMIMPAADDVLTRAVTVEDVTVGATEAVKGGVEEEQKRKEAGKSMRLFRTLSVFCGAGGMDIGFAGTANDGFFRTEWAIDTCETSAKTYAQHHPCTRYFVMDAGDALENRKTNPAMPQVGAVDVVLLGPPCQSFSTLVSVECDQRIESG